MKQKDLRTLIIAAVITAVFSFIVAGALFGGSTARSSSVPVVQTLSSTFPDVKNDPNYNTFLNSNALDPTEFVHISSNHNTTPFGNGP